MARRCCPQPIHSVAAIAMAAAIMVSCLSPPTTAFVFGSRRSNNSDWNRIQTRGSRATLQLSSMRNYLDFDNSGESGMAPTSDTHNNQHPRRLPIVAGNWKLNPSTVQEATTLLKLLASNFVHHRSSAANTPEVVVFPPTPYLERAVTLLEGTGIQVGAQTISSDSKGAFTGEVSPSMVRSLGCSYVLVGHSERRTLYGESDELVNAKIKLALQEDAGLSVVLCVGETLEEYESSLLESVIHFQVTKALNGISSVDASTRLVVAYEPVWAIGTGKVATPQQAQTAHEVVRGALSELYGPETAQTIRIQYGGSVTPDSVSELMAMPDVDGALVGGASLTADGFSRIVDGAAATSEEEKNWSHQQQQFPPKELTALEVVSCKNVLGESPIWSVRDQTLYWISAPEEEVWAWNMIDPPYRRLFGTTIGCIALKAAESSGAGGNILVAGESAFLETTMGNNDFSSTIFCDRPEQQETTRPNDGRADREGNLVVGMYNNYHRAGASEGQNNCGLYRLCPTTRTVQSLFPPEYKYRVSNCISFSPDGGTMYFCDTPTRKVYAFDYPQTTANKNQHQYCTNRRLIWTMPPNLAGGPDGAQVDADGGLWMALSGAGMVVRVHPDRPGIVDCVVHLPVKSPTSCTFGGPNLDELFVTTRGPDGGGLYRVKMPFGIRGLPEPEFGGGTEAVAVSANLMLGSSRPASIESASQQRDPQHSLPTFGSTDSTVRSYLDSL